MACARAVGYNICCTNNTVLPKHPVYNLWKCCAYTGIVQCHVLCVLWIFQSIGASFLELDCNSVSNVLIRHP